VAIAENCFSINIHISVQNEVYHFEVN
jgi:hypothetical protein